MITSEIEAHEDWEIAGFDTPGAYIHTLTYEEVIMLLNVTL